MGKGSSRYVQVYCNEEKVRSVGGSSGRVIIDRFWNNLEYYMNINALKSLFPIGCEQSCDKLMYLVQMQKRSANKRRIRKIVVTKYSKDEKLITFTEMHASTPNLDHVVWFGKDELDYVEIKEGKSTIYTVTAVTKDGRRIPITVNMDKHWIQTGIDKKTTDIVPCSGKVNHVTPSASNPSYNGRKYPVVTLCGSTKFKDDFIDSQRCLTLSGHVVISVGLFGHADGLYDTVLTPEKKELLDDIHRQKIDMADFIFVINKDDYIGESTRNEINYAIEKGKPVMYKFPHIE